MKRMLLRSLMIALGVFAVADDARSAGINLSWDDCGLNGTMTQTFACDQNTGTPFTMYGSFIPPPGVEQFLGMSAQIAICNFTTTPVDWWAHGAGLCRGTGALVTDFNFITGPFTCEDFFVGRAAGGFAYDFSYGSPGTSRLRIQCAVPTADRGPVDPSTEYHAFKVSIGRSKSTGAGSCAGCNVRATIILNELQLFQPPSAVNDPLIFNPIDRQFVFWQEASFNCIFVPVRNSSWGQVKALYR